MALFKINFLSRGFNFNIEQKLALLVFDYTGVIFMELYQRKMEIGR